MNSIIFFLGLITGCFLCLFISKFSFIIASKATPEKYINSTNWSESIKNTKVIATNIAVISISGLSFLISFLQIGLNVIFIQAIVLNSILIVVSFVDIENQIIPNKIIIFTLGIGVIFAFFDNISFMSALFGMILGGGMLLLLALVPGVLGGGDIKLMFVLGIFLGVKGALFAIFIAFVLASIVSILLLLFKIKKRKDYIPFGPFLALGTFIAFNFLSII